MVYYYAPTYSITANQFPGNAAYQQGQPGFQAQQEEHTRNPLSPVCQPNGQQPVFTTYPQSSPQQQPSQPNIPIYVQPNSASGQPVMHCPTTSPQASRAMVGGYPQVSMMHQGQMVTYMMYPCYSPNSYVYSGYGSPMQYPMHQTYASPGYSHNVKDTNVYQPEHSGAVQQIGVTVRA